MSATAAAQELMLCRTCGQLNRPAPESGAMRCARCASHLHWRKPNSFARTWAFVIAAALLYIPANLLPVIQSTTITSARNDTIMGGVVFFWTTGSWMLAIIVFTASIVVPGTKIVALVLLLVTSQRRSLWRPVDRTRLYRLNSYIGRWSMVDIYVGALSVALVQLRPFAEVLPGPGAVFFGAVVILTMLGSESFDPRLIWDAVDRRHE